MVGWICTERRKISVKSESWEWGGEGRWEKKRKKIFKSYLQLKKKRKKKVRATVPYWYTVKYYIYTEY